MARKNYADRTERIIPCTRDIAPPDKNTDPHKGAKNIHRISYP